MNSDAFFLVSRNATIQTNFGIYNIFRWLKRTIQLCHQQLFSLSDTIHSMVSTSPQFKKFQVFEALFQFQFIYWTESLAFMLQPCIGQDHTSDWWTRRMSRIWSGSKYSSMTWIPITVPTAHFLILIFTLYRQSVQQIWSLQQEQSSDRCPKGKPILSLPHRKGKNCLKLGLIPPNPHHASCNIIHELQFCLFPCSTSQKN